MKISVNQIKRLNEELSLSGNPAPEGVGELITRIGAQLGAVEETIPVGSQYKDVVVVKIVSCEDHPNADRLHVCKIDDGGVNKSVERDADGLVQVVCGAPNARAGIKVVWLAPGVTVPDSVLTDEPFVLGARELRGVVSNGMLASPRELAIGDSHEGILEIDDDNVAIGSDFAEVYGLKDDVVIDMENKMFTHRPDCFGVLGVARELAGIRQQAFTSPDWYRYDIDFFASGNGDLKVEIENRIPEVVPRFVALPMSGISIKPSPVWLQIDLARLGVRPINNVVDLTNYYMLLTGQPLHAYDYDKVVAQDAGATTAKLVVRYPDSGEKLLLLSGKEITPRSEAIMIATRDTAIGLGGVMGGGDTEVDENTKNIILECANFDMYSIRRTSMASGVFTDAVTRFNKGQSPLQNVAVIKRIAEDVITIAGGSIAGKLVDDNHVAPEVLAAGSLERPVELTRQFINDRLGFDLSVDEIAALLRNVEFDVNIEDDMLRVTAPFWRTDVAIPEDVVEEVGRLYGFDHLPLELPKRDLTPVKRDPMVMFKSKLRRILSRGGANEVLSYSFVHGNLLKRARQDTENVYRIANALSPDLQYYRASLTPSLLDKVNSNIRGGAAEFALFEINKTHAKEYGDDNEGLPKEVNHLALVVATDVKTAKSKQGSAYFAARAYLDYVAEQLGLEFVYQMIVDDTQAAVSRPFALQRSAVVSIKGQSGQIGIIGEYHQDVARDMKLPDYCAGFEVNLDLLSKYTQSTFGYKALSRYPKVARDICLRLPFAVTYAELADFVDQTLPTVVPDSVLAAYEPLDIYVGEDQQHRQITITVDFVSSERTLTADEVNKYVDAFAAAAKAELTAEVV